MTGETRLVLRNDFGELRRLAAFVKGEAARIGLASKTTFAVELCLEEAVSNIVRHGADRGKATRIIATLGREPDEVTLCVEDDGPPFDPTSVDRPLPAANLDEAAIGGFGIHLMREFSNRMRYERSGEENRLIMTFRVAQPATAVA